jgi:hypothetical protein
MKETNRTNVAAYLAEQRYLRGDLGGAKTLTQMAAERGTTKTTMRRWLRRDHWELWMEHWASADELWEAAIHDRARLQEEKRSSDECYPKVLVAELDRCLAELTNEVCIIQ